MALDDDGNPLSGGLLYTYKAGTSTALATYTTATMGTANANPVVLDSRGEATIFGSGNYKFVLKDSDGVTIWTEDNVFLSLAKERNYFSVDPTEADQGVAGGGATLYDILTALGVSEEATVFFPHTGAANTTTYTLSTSLSANNYKNVTFVFERGAVLSVDASKSFSAVSAPSAGAYRIFSGTGAIYLIGAELPIKAEWFGVNKDESAANNDAYLTRAFVSGKHIKISKPGTYSFDTIVIRTDTDFEIGKHVVISKTASDTSTYAIKAVGAIGSTTTALSVDANIGAYSITVDNCSGLSTGTYIYIQDDEWNGTANVYKHEMNVIDAVADPVLKLKYPICNNYKTGSSAKITKVDTVIKNVNIYGEGEITSSVGTTSYGIYAEYAHNLKISGLKIYGFYNHGISLRYSLDCTVFQTEVYDAIAFESGQGYGISLTQGTSHSSVIGNRLRKLRHALVAGIGASFNLYQGNHCRGYHTNALDGIDTHGGFVHHDRYIDNFIEGMEQDGIWTADPYNEFINNTIVGCKRFGINLTKYIHDGITSVASNCTVQNNTIRHYAANRAIYASSYDSGDDTDTDILENLIIADNRISLHASASSANVCGIYGRGLSGIVRGNQIIYENPANTVNTSAGIDIREWTASGNYGLINRIKISENQIYGGYYNILFKGDSDGNDVSNNQCEDAYHTGIALFGRGAANTLNRTKVHSNQITHSGDLTYGVYVNDCTKTSLIGTQFCVVGTLSNMIAEAGDTLYTTIKHTGAEAGTITTPFTWTNRTGCRGEQAVLRIGTIAAETDDERPIWAADGLIGCEITDILLVNAVDITQNDTNYETFTIWDRGPTGAGGNKVVECTTKTTGGLAFEDFDPESMGAVSATHSLLERHTVISFGKVHGGSGQGIDEMMVIIRYVEY